MNLGRRCRNGFRNPWDESMKVIIAGGGIGGLATAIALKKLDIPALVLEQAPMIEEVGAGLGLSPNALKALRRLGLERQTIESGSIIEHSRVVTQNGIVLNEIDIGELGRQVGAPSVCIRRADLQKSLLEKLVPGVLMTDARCVGFTERAQSVKVHLADGRTIEGEFLIGADGIHSAVRKALLGEAASRYAGYVSWRAVISGGDFNLLPGYSLLGLGYGSQMGMFHCGQQRIYWFATKNAPAQGPDSQSGRKDEIVRLSDTWASPFREVIAGTPEDAMLKSDILDRPPNPKWGRGRVTLLGDAAHAATPNLAQGACQALEDAVTLAACLGRSPSPEGLRRYERLRYERTARAVRESWRLGQLLQLQNPLSVWARNRFMQSSFGKRLAIASMKNWIGFEVPEL
jgi:2-polyprenyl-6-methoxyphenol hydroxylase-like FAD-dependent oxidoreductase